MNIQKININKLTHNYNKNILTSIRKKFSGKVKNANTEILPVVTVPLVAYMATVKKTMNDLESNKAIEQANNYKPNNVTWNEQQSRKELKSLGITQKSEQNRFITKKGTIKQDDLDKYKQKHSISHKGLPDDTQPYEHDMHDYNDIHSDIPTSGGGFSTIEPDHHGMGFGQISAGFGELELPDSADITEQLGHVADMLDNPVLEGVAAELLPGTKFLKPGKDLIDGDYEKAA